MVKKLVKKKKTIKKKTSVKKKTTPKIAKSHKGEITQTASEVRVERILVNNFVSLQKVMVNLSTRIDSLTGKMSKLLDLFELSARALAEKDFNLEQPRDTEKEDKMLIKLDNLAEQNKIIAKGLTIIHEKEAPLNIPKKITPPRPTLPIPQKPGLTPPKREEIPQPESFEDYEKSITSEPPEFKEFEQEK